MSAGVRSVLPPSRFKIVKDGFYRKVVATLPKPYQKFYYEWKDNEDKETPVHWKPREGRWERNPETGEVKVIQNEPIPVSYPNEMHKGIWGGEGVIDGLVKKAKYRSPVSRFWTPTLKKTVVYSEILDKYLSVTVTERALKLIDESNGFDSYLLKTPAYDLKSLLALKLKRVLLLTLIDKNFCHNNQEKQTKLLQKYKEYIIPKDEAEWYGYSVEEAKTKYEFITKQQANPKPLKYELRNSYIEELRESKDDASPSNGVSQLKPSWTTRLNPFSKPPAAS